MLTESSRRPEAAPAIILLNEFVTPSVVLKFASDPALKQAIQRRRRAHRPKDKTKDYVTLFLSSVLYCWCRAVDNNTNFCLLIFRPFEFLPSAMHPEHLRISGIFFFSFATMKQRQQMRRQSAKSRVDDATEQQLKPTTEAETD